MARKVSIFSVKKKKKGIHISRIIYACYGEYTLVFRVEDPGEVDPDPTVKNTKPKPTL
mgnify:CR=1 FL=1